MNFEPLSRDLNVIKYVQRRCVKVVEYNTKRIRRDKSFLSLYPQDSNKSKKLQKSIEHCELELSEAQKWLGFYEVWVQNPTEENFYRLRVRLKYLSFV